MRQIQSYIIEANQPLWRIHNVCYQANQFNRNKSGNGRFNPLIVRKSYQSTPFVLPTLYAANQYHEAFAETIMRQDNQYRVLSEKILADHQLSVISPKTDLILADLDAPWVPEIIKEAIHQPQQTGVYLMLREFAIRLVKVAPHIQGFKWRSVQRDILGQSVYVLIDHVAKKPIKLNADQYSASLISTATASKLKECAELFGYVLPDDYL